MAEEDAGLVVGARVRHPVGDGTVRFLGPVRMVVSHISRWHCRPACIFIFN